MDTVEFAGFWIRVGAVIIDFVVYLLPVGILFAIVPESSQPLIGISGAIGLYAYFILLTAFNNGQTVGKKLLRIQVVDVNANPPSLGREMLREIIGKGVLSNGFLLLGYLWVAFSAEKRGWHDYISGTFVTRKV